MEYLNSSPIHGNASYGTPFRPTMVIVDVVLFTLGVPILLVNGLGMVVLWKSTKLPFQIRILTLNMTFADCLTGLTMCFPREWLYGECNIRKYILETLGTCSFLTITLFNMDRCLVIMYAIHYTVFITRTKVLMSCSLTWFLSLFLANLLYSDEDIHTMGFTCEEPFVGNKIYLTNFIAHGVRLFTLILNIIMLVILCVYLRKRMKNQSKLSQFKLKHWDYQTITIRKILIITACFTILYTPYLLCQVIIFSHVNGLENFAIKGISAALSMTNSLVNPFLYIFRFTECRYQLRLLFCKCNKSVIEDTKRERKQSFATYLIDDINKLRLQKAIAKKSGDIHSSLNSVTGHDSDCTSGVQTSTGRQSGKNRLARGHQSNEKRSVLDKVMDSEKILNITKMYSNTKHAASKNKL